MCQENVMRKVRGCLSFIGFIFLIAGVSLQFISAGNLYGVPLPKLCEAYSGSDEVSDVQGFQVFIQAVLEQRDMCLDMAVSPNFDAEENRAAVECCRLHSPSSAGRDGWILKGVCAKPWLTNLNIFTETANERLMTPHEKMDLYTSILGDFIGVSSAGKYFEANPEFWCKNCPNDYRRNCPFEPPPNSTDQLCACPGGRIAAPDDAFWAMEGDHQLTSDFVTCGEKAKVYRSWLEALFEDWSKDELDNAERQFNSKCWQGKGALGYILTCGPVLSVFAGFFCGLAHVPIFANSPIRDIGFNFAMLAISLTLVAFWPLSFTGAAGIISRYNFCAGLEYPVVHNLTAHPTSRYRNAPVFFNGNPCYDLNSAGEVRYNPFVMELGKFNSGYVSGGVLVILALSSLLAVISKGADVIVEEKLQENREDEPGRR
mmetsp:Transcript_18689/g.44502  ORF Transcript_18689/g.44502 Transcript_18689/m.44502 type:complete len:429 (-) Transcript_18689:105-1391(-)